MDGNAQGNRFRGGNPGQMGIQVFLVEIVNAIVVIFMWMNNLGKDWEVITRIVSRCDDICMVIQLHRARGQKRH